MLNAQQIIDHLQLQPLTIEGGYFRETYRSPLVIPADALPDGYDGGRNMATAIYYLITPDTFSALHRVRSDEVFHFYAGDAVEMLQLWPDGSGAVVVIGNDLAAGQTPQVVVPAGVWQGCRLLERDATSEGDNSQRFGWALMGCTVAPGFDYADFTAGARQELTAAYPDFARQIARLTPSA